MRETAKDLKRMIASSTIFESLSIKIPLFKQMTHCLISGEIRRTTKVKEVYLITVNNFQIGTLTKLNFKED